MTPGIFFLLFLSRAKVRKSGRTGEIFEADFVEEMIAHRCGLPICDYIAAQKEYNVWGNDTGKQFGCAGL